MERSLNTMDDFDDLKICNQCGGHGEIIDYHETYNVFRPTYDLFPCSQCSASGYMPRRSLKIPKSERDPIKIAVDAGLDQWKTEEDRKRRSQAI